MSAIFCVVLSCVGRGLAMGQLPSTESYQMSKRVRKDGRTFSRKVKAQNGLQHLCSISRNTKLPDFIALKLKWPVPLKDTNIFTTPTDHCASLCVQTSSGAHPASCPMGTGGPFPGGRARPRRDADHSPPSSAKLKMRSYTSSPPRRHHGVAGQLYFLQIIASSIFIPGFLTVRVVMIRGGVGKGRWSQSNHVLGQI
jgi:hypothetical protein